MTLFVTILKILKIVSQQLEKNIVKRWDEDEGVQHQHRHTGIRTVDLSIKKQPFFHQAMTSLKHQ